ncbi:LLM class F420-dependent oxidoreductase [Gordonia sp. HY285]|uniref:LLM class F420-dependent oxidoreductase n=1 Tax=Gordonia liuliyuniae TaxID=2911517 RepID=UPI001F4549E0|nr:LLM class F420-dependent oxidoreductase [Gordonia liuliyuniae]MCF8608587.1 LLM class F420-dependent oxidoreductase [Gordonia liuliyuniae]
MKHNTTIPRFGISTPIVVQVPGVASPWEADAGVDDLTEIAATADRLGFDYLTCAEHVAVPTSAEGRGVAYWDPLSTLSFLAASTERIRLATSVLVLGYHHPLEIAKRYGTLDRLSSGRVILGVGVGSLEEEFDLLGAAWRGRGSRADDAMRALRASLSQQRPEYHGEHYDYDGLIVEPCGVQESIPLWVGGRSLRSLRRAVELGDGWMPFGLGVGALRDLLAQADVPTGFEIVLGTAPLDPIWDPGRAMEKITRLLDSGATSITCTLTADSAANYSEQLAALTELVAPLREEK